MKTKFCILMFFSLLFIFQSKAQSTSNWSNQYDEVGKFYDGLAWVKLDYKYGFVDQTGKKVTPLKYDFVGDFSEGLAMVMTGDFEGLEEPKCGFINKTGTEVIPLKYSKAEKFSEGLAMVMTGDVQTSQSAALRSLPNGFNIFRRITYWPFGTT